MTRVDPPCRYFGHCGGCALQDLSYPDQLALKRERLQQTLAPLGGLPIEIIGLDDPWRYRQKSEMSFGTDGTGLILGYHAAGSYRRVVDLEDCLLLPAFALPPLRSVLRHAKTTGQTAYHPRTHQGWLRYAIARTSRLQQRVMLCLVTASGSRETAEQLAQAVMDEHPEIAGFWWGTTDRLADAALPEQLTLLRGEATMEEQVGPFRLTMDPLSFVQASTVQAHRLYTAVCLALGDLREAVAWDLYSGIGTIALYLAGQVRRVYAIDSEPRHTELAAQNAAANGITNLSPWTGRVETLLRDRRFWMGEAKPDVVVVDPPRAGLHPGALSSILAARPKQLAYISCSAQSLARDAALLQSCFPRYRPTAITAFDMFPQTNHVETFALFERAG